MDKAKANGIILKSTMCYISGRPIDIMDKGLWSLDHKIPRSKGGSNSVDNMGVCNSLVNRSKQDMTVDEFIEMCHDVLCHNGYTVRKTNL